MPKVRLICTKPWGYNTRRLQANDSFDAKDRNDANILVNVLKIARYDYDALVKEALAASVAAPPPAFAPPAPTPVFHYPIPAPVPAPAPVAPHHDPDPLDALRSEAESLGVRVDRRWGEARLSDEIDAALEKKAAAEPPQTEEPSPVAMTADSASALAPSTPLSDEE